MKALNASEVSVDAGNIQTTGSQLSNEGNIWNFTDVKLLVSS